MNDMTLCEWFDIWIETYKRRTVKIDTIYTYNELFKVHIAPMLGERRVAEIRAAEIQKMLNAMADSGYSDGTIELTKTLIKSIFRKAAEDEVADKDPTVHVITPKGRRRRECTVFTKEEQQIFMEFASVSDLENMFRLAIFTGMRGGELCALQWNDVSFENEMIYVRHTLKSDYKGGYRLDSPKSANSRREIPMMPQAKLLLKKMQADRGSNGSYVFQRCGKPITKNNINAELKRVRNAISAAGIAFPYFTMHTTRHTFATRCIEAGMKPKVLQLILGHSSITTTMEIYVTVQNAEKALEMQYVSKAF